MASVVGLVLGWLRGAPPHKAKHGSPAGGGANGQSLSNVVQWKSRRKAQVVFRESRDLWYTRMSEALTYDEWHLAAERLDEIDGHLEWKNIDASAHYDSNLLRERLRQVQQMEAQENISSLMNWLRGGLQRNFVGTGNIELFEHSHVGTKTLIERHHCEMTRLLYEVANCREDAMPLEKRLAFFTEARHALGKSALLLSGGLGLGMYHLGVVKALHEQCLLPRIISASSFGAVVAAVVGTSTIDQLSLLFDSLFEQDGNICANLQEAQVDSLNTKLHRLFYKGHLLDAAKLESALKASLGDVTFHEAYERTGRIINITIAGSGELNHDRPRFLNYLTAPNILLWSAASASCALSGGFSEKILAKDVKGNIFVYDLKAQVKAVGKSNGGAAAGAASAVEGGEKQHYQPWEDCSGEGVHAEMPMNRLKELFNVNFFIVSQNTACALPFVQRTHKAVRHDSSASSRVSLSLVRRLTYTLGYLLRSEVLHRCEQAISLGLAPKLLKQALNQTYVGDVTIAPGPLEVCGKLIFKKNHVAQREFVVLGQQRTWPCISQIRGQCEVEMVLDQCVRHLAAQVQRKAQQRASRCNTQVFSPQFRQQRHTHLDLNQYFSSPDAPNGSSSNVPSTCNSTLLPLKPNIRACLSRRNLSSLIAEGTMEIDDDPAQPRNISNCLNCTDGEDGLEDESDCQGCVNPRVESSKRAHSTPQSSQRVLSSFNCFARLPLPVCHKDKAQ